jgi:hypothetical protein
VDLGPEGGDAGGHVVAVGTPEEIAANPASYTGQYLKQVFDRRRGTKAAKRAAAAERRSAPPRRRSDACLLGEVEQPSSLPADIIREVGGSRDIGFRSRLSLNQI